ncbi:MAG: C25 family cysteine peptidase [Bacteroidota bacterium]|nr:C25 family cysteine peptidase [Bacteroidota bacterium]
MELPYKYSKVLLIITLLIPFVALSEDTAVLKIVSSNPKELILQYVPQEYKMQPVEIEGETYFIPIGAKSGLTSETGKSSLPVEGTLIALPPNTKIDVEIIESKYLILQNQNIAPYPLDVFDEDGNASLSYQIDRKFYERETNFYPKEVFKLEQPIRLRDFNVAKINLHPLQYIPSTKMLKHFTHLVLKISFIDELNKNDVTLISTADREFESVYKSLILNYDQARNWRFKERPADLEKSNINQSWWQTNNQYYKILIAQDGMYRLTNSYLLDVGINLQTIPTNSLAMYYQGKSIPMDVNTENPDVQNWYIDFYGTRKYGDSTFFDPYTDTSYYWLTWNDPLPTRFTKQAANLITPVYTANSCTTFRHFERDSNYYYGYNDNEIRTVDNVKGEGWYWLDFVGTASKSITFNIDTLNPGRFDSAYFKARFHGMTAYDDTNRSRHQVRVTLNGKVLGEVLWTQNQELILSTSFIDTLLKKGTNTLLINSTMIKLSKFYIDWFQVTYRSPISVQNNYFDFSAPAQPTDAVTLFRIAKVTSDSIDVFDLTSYRKIVNTLKDAQGWAFLDSSLSSKRYIVTGKNQRVTPSSIIPHTFKNIRSNPDGADYIAVTHSLFKNPAITLANSRSAFGLRTAVVDVQDIYDEFNYGHIDPLSIKEFFKHAYNLWTAPSPSYIVMFGDACIDYKKKFPSTTKTNFVPGYGIPMSDNALVCFDSVYNYLPAIIIGRIPVENQIQAARVVQKITDYDNPPMDFWNKRTLFVTGGTTASERWQFNSLSDMLINESITPSPLGGLVYKVYKTSSAIIDGDYKYYMQGLVNEGLSFVNFIGHSGGRIWNVDIGNPNDLQNTNGKLPFISSVSCNIGAFYTHFANVLSEDFLFADNRGGIGAWASSHIGSANTGFWLARKFLNAATRESVKTLGELTHLSRIYFWTINDSISTPTVIHTFNLYPLIGDPYSKFALPQKPDLGIDSESVFYSPSEPVADNFVYLKLIVKNFGLMPTDSVLITIKDNYTDELGKTKGESDVVAPFKVKPVAYADTINIEWDVRGKAGSHTVTINIDPLNQISESNESNNSAQVTIYINKNVIYPIKPLTSSVVNSGIQNLSVSVPMAFDSARTSTTEKSDSLIFPKNTFNITSPYTFYFEIDTTNTFDSPAKVSSPPIQPGAVSANWVTPPLLNEKVYFWRARSYNGKHYGAWANSEVNVSDTAYSSSIVKWKQTHPKQFASNPQKLVSVSDSGVTMQRTNGLSIYVRSLGYRAFPDSDYYSIIRIGTTTIFGHWWSGANSYLAARIDPLTGQFEAKGYTLSTLGQPDSLLRFIQTAPVGYYIVISVVRDGRGGMTETLYQTFESLGAQFIRTVTAGQSWALISRKGSSTPMMPPRESYSPNAVADTDYQMPSYYSAGIGEISSLFIGPVTSWKTLSWNNSIPAKTDIQLKLVGLKKDFTVDTLRTLLGSEIFADISNINSSIYLKIQLVSTLRNTDGEATPTLKSWQVNYTAPIELATSPAEFNAPRRVDRTQPFDVEVNVHNLSNQTVDSVNVTFVLAPNSFLNNIWIDSIPAGEAKLINKSLDVSQFTGEQILITSIEPKLNLNELILENNVLSYPFYVDQGVSVLENVIVTFDGKEIRNGDYVSSMPTIQVSLPENFPMVDLTAIYLDGENILTERESYSQKSSTTTKIELKPTLTDGDHKLIISGRNNSNLISFDFKVSNTPQILSIFNYPNPFTTGTQFTFELTGQSGVERVTILVYSVAGRQLKELTATNVNIGFNSIVWDGRDNDGNELGNGVYLYKIKAKFENEVNSQVQKLVKLR